MFNFFKKNRQNKSESPKPQSNFIDKLELVKYFEFTNHEDKAELVKNIQDSYHKSGTFSTSYKNNKSTCNKLFFCDTERLFEGNGYASQIADMKNGIENVADFNRIRLAIPDSFDYDSNPKSNWHDAVVDFTNRINAELENANSDYKIYPANGGNEGFMYILNQQQFDLLNKYVDDRQIRPHEIINWNRIFNTTQEEYKKYIEREEFKFSLGMSLTLKNHGKVKVIKVINDKCAEIQVGEKIAQIDLITGHYKLTFKDEENKNDLTKESTYVKPEFLREGMKIKHLKYGKGQILEINDKGVANIKFEDGNKRIILKFAKIELDE